MCLFECSSMRRGKEREEHQALRTWRSHQWCYEPCSANSAGGVKDKVLDPESAEKSTRTRVEIEASRVQSVVVPPVVSASPVRHCGRCCPPYKKKSQPSHLGC